ncbi:MAG: DUF4838 domain-containing protein [Lentisphaerae bacterium]|nr:DUF4838 domain-containing protein [Lentisphaerota bacterium]
MVEYIEKISGARPEVIEGLPDPLPERAIWVGYQPVLHELFPEVDFDFQHPEEILIAVNDRHAVVAGRDVWHPEHMQVELRRDTVDGVQQEYGTVNAVYTFLQDFLGVRWFWPGELGTDFVKQDTIALAPQVYRYHPPIRYRSGLIRLSSLDGRGHSKTWTRRQRLQLDSLQCHGGHVFSGWWDRFHEDHPEYFALQPNGTRRWSSARTTKLCKSNPAVWDQWLRDVEESLERNPNQVAFGAGANDGGHGGYCICENCRAWDDPDGTLVRLYWEGLAQEYPALSDRQVTFANHLARLLKKRYPDKDYFVIMQAYGASRPPPVSAKLDDNVIVNAVFNFHNRQADGDYNHRELFLKWAKFAPHISWRPNLGHGAELQRGMLNIGITNAIADMRLAAENGVIGLFFDTITEHWATQGPYYYILGQMAWNPHADGQAIMDDYYQRAFGKAAQEMQAYWEMIEMVAQSILFEGVDLKQAWDVDFFQRARDYLARAEATVAAEPEIYRERIRFVGLGLDYTELLLEAERCMDRFKESKGQDTAAADQARALWVERIRPLVESKEYPHAFNAFLVRPGAWPFRDRYFPDDLRGKKW